MCIRDSPTDRAFHPRSTPPPVEADASVPLRITRYRDTMDLLPAPLEIGSIVADGPIEIDALDTLRAEDLPVRTTYNLSLRSTGILPVPEALRHGQVARATKNLPDQQRTRALALPEIDASIIALARDVAGDAEPAIRAIHIAQHLRSNHAYSLAYDPGDADPLTDFVLNRRAAHCQYFAAAMVVMARAADVPARYVSGYLAHEVDGDRVVVRDRDAHAWAECWIDGMGWVTFDATPASGLPDQIFPQPSRWRRMWERLQDFPAAVREYFADRATQAMMVMVGVPVLGVVLLWLLVRGWWRLKPHSRGRKYAAPSEDLVAIGRRFERLMKRRGAPCPANTTWRQHLRDISRQSPPAIMVDVPLRFVDVYEEARFGQAGGAVRERLQELLVELER